MASLFLYIQKSIAENLGFEMCSSSNGFLPLGFYVVLVIFFFWVILYLAFCIWGFALQFCEHFMDLTIQGFCGGFVMMGKSKFKGLFVSSIKLTFHHVLTEVLVLGF